jgi:hypothetical protein
MAWLRLFVVGGWPRWWGTIILSERRAQGIAPVTNALW